jgi:hypothetical protein
MTAVLVLAESSSHTPVKLRKFSHQFINNRALRKFAISLTFLVISLGRPPLHWQPSDPSGLINLQTLKALFNPSNLFPFQFQRKFIR